MLGLAGIILGNAPGHAHGWYPLECCSENDCMPAGDLERDARGRMTVIVGDLRIGIPEGFVPRRSRDSRAHICFRVHSDYDGSIIARPICLFLPAQA